MKLPPHLEKSAILLNPQPGGTDCPPDAEEVFVKAVELQCMLSIHKYLVELADTMKENNIESISADSIKAMAESLKTRSLGPTIS